MEHHLKTWPVPYEAVRRGDKTFEIRSNDDRDFAVGDVLCLHKWSPGNQLYITADGYHTRHEEESALTRTHVTYVLHGGRFGLPRGICAMSIVKEK